MGQELAPQPQLQTISSLEQKISNAKAILAATTTSPVEAAKAAKQLVGSYAHLRPSDPDTFVMSIAAVLSAYPLGLVLRCADPRIGAARKLKFLSIAELVEWLDEEQRHFRVVAAAKPVPRRPELPPPPPTTAEQRATVVARILARIAEVFKAEDPISRLKREARQKAADKLRIHGELVE